MATYETILSVMTANMEKLGKCVIAPESDIGIKFKVVASEIARLHDMLANYEKQIFPRTADGEFLDKHGEVKGLFRKVASKSTGAVQFSTKIAATSKIFIPKGTRLTSTIATDVLYQTVSDAEIAVGKKTVIVNVESVSIGKDTELAPTLLDILVNPIAGISSVINPSKISGGSDIEPDELFRNRVSECYSTLTNGANLSYYELLAKTVKDVWYAKAEFATGQTNQINIYVENLSRTISTTTIAEVQSLLTTAREVGINVTVSKPVRKNIDISATIQIANMINSSAILSNVTKFADTFIKNLSIGEAFSPAKFSTQVFTIDGVVDIIIASPTGNLPIASNEIAYCGTISCTTKL